MGREHRKHGAGRARDGAGLLDHCPATTQLSVSDLLLLQYPHALRGDGVVVAGLLGGEQQEGAGCPVSPWGTGVDLGRDEHNGLESRRRS